MLQVSSLAWQVIISAKHRSEAGRLAVTVATMDGTSASSAWSLGALEDIGTRESE